MAALPHVSKAQQPGLTPPMLPADATVTLAGSPVALSADGPHALTKPDVEAWLDGLMLFAIQRGDIAGGVVVVVKDGAILSQSGYGFCDAAARTPVDPALTLFRAGSVSKLFTWTAVMQLVEQGKIDLDADVNRFLDFKIPSRDGKAVTMRNLMTHTPGFDEISRNLIITDAKNLPRLDQVLKHWIPPLVTTPGSTPAYSNYGAALAGYIVQRVSGIPFDDYIEQKIFARLEMNQATFRQPLPDRLQPFMSKGYKVGSAEPEPFEVIDVAPAASLSVSGTDMAQIMIGHLQNGSFGLARILQEQTAIQMHTTGKEILPPLNGMLLGFYASNINGRRVISHAGDTQWFHSDLNLLPDDGTGIFISMNSGGKNGAAQSLRRILLEQFMQRYFPGPLPDGNVDAASAKAHARMIEGRYAVSRRAHTTFLSLLNISEIPVAPNADGTITIAALNGGNDQPKKWREIAPFVWRSTVGGDRVAAQVENGRVIGFGYDGYPFMLFERVPWWWSSGWLLPLWIAALVALALTALAWPISALVRRRYGVAYGLTGRLAKAHRLVRIASAADFVMMLLVGFTVALIASDLKWAQAGMDGVIIALRVLASIVFIAAALIALWSAGVVVRSKRRKLAKLWSLVLAISTFTVLYVAIVFHIIGFTANY